LRDLKGRHAKIDERRTRIPAAVVVQEDQVSAIEPEISTEEAAEIAEGSAQAPSVAEIEVPAEVSAGAEAEVPQ
jgi:hypothetical protein